MAYELAGLLPLVQLAGWGVVIQLQLFGVTEYGRLHAGDALYARSTLIEEKIIFPSCVAAFIQ